MTTIRQLIQKSPDKTNELFAKLVDTSDAAVKTRDRLLSELKVEIEDQAKVQEQHLFPVLKKHKETKDLVAEALEDNKETRKLLAELERTPKDSKEFATKVVELRKVFQQHVRDEKKELLPAVLKALTDEEADAVVEKIEDEKAKVEAARRAEVKREREAVETAKKAAEDTVNTARAGAESAQQSARAAQDAARSGFNAAADMTKRGAEQFTSLTSDVTRQAQESSEQAQQNMQVVTQTGSVLASGYQDVSREWLAMSQAVFQKNMEGLNAMMRCRSLPELIAAQSSLVRDNVELTIESSRRIAKLSVGIADKAGRSFEEQTSKNAERSKRAA